MKFYSISFSYDSQVGDYRLYSTYFITAASYEIASDNFLAWYANSGKTGVCITYVYSE